MKTHTQIRGESSIVLARISPLVISSSDQQRPWIFEANKRKFDKEIVEVWRMDMDNR